MLHGSEVVTDHIAIIRRFWAANNILQNPFDLRDWETLPTDVMTHVLECLDSSTLASLRLVCKVWNACVNHHVDKICLG